MSCLLCAVTMEALKPTASAVVKVMEALISCSEKVVSTCPASSCHQLLRSAEHSPTCVGARIAAFVV